MNFLKIHKTTFFLFISLGINSYIQAQEVIKFRISENNNIIVKALVNDTDSLDLMFQIAMDNASISPERIKPANSILFKNEISLNNKLQIADLKWNNIVFFDNELTGKEADGKIGTSIFKNKIYQIDYDNNQFVIYNQLPDVEKYKQIPYTTNKYGQIFIRCNNVATNKSFEEEFLLQSGYSGGLLYSNETADSNNLNHILKITAEKTLRNSANQSIITKQGVLPILEIKDIALNDVSAGFFAGEIKNQSVNYFGADLIKRFNWIFDQENKIAYFTPSKYYNNPYLKLN